MLMAAIPRTTQLANIANTSQTTAGTALQHLTVDHPMVSILRISSSHRHGKLTSAQPGHTVIEGQSYPVKSNENPDGAGGQQIFWGNYRVDRGGDYTIDTASCTDYMNQIYNSCGGFGGWINTSFGTVSGLRSFDIYL